MTVSALSVAALPLWSAAAAEDKRDVAVITRGAGCCPVTDTLRIVTANGAPVRPVLSRATTSGLLAPTWSL